LAFSNSPVVVVSRLVDLDLYLDVLESGASDFIVPPFQASDVAYVVSGALLDGPRGAAAAAATAGKAC
jgi:FixJ family two-component response regulator